MHTVEIRGAMRTVGKRSDTRQLRTEGKVPGVLYGKEEGSLPISIDSRELGTVMRKYGGTTFLLDLKLEGQEGRELKALVKELQRHPVTSRILHIDLLHVSMTQSIHVNVPIHLTGTAAGVKEGGLLEQLCREIEVQCRVADIPEELTVDISELVIGHSIHVRDLALPGDVTVLTPADRVVATVVTRAIVVEPTPAEVAAEGEEKAEGEPKAAGVEEGSKTEQAQAKS
jgi:large subunit ribosomal protein L25